MKRPPGAYSGRRIEAFLDNFFFCPSCTSWRRTRPLRWTAPTTSSSRTRNSNRRHASTSSGTLTSTTAVNAQKPVPVRYRPLYESLLNVRKKASAQVNLSRLQLALQGLESESPVTRVAVLGLNVQDTASKVVRLLLADALEDEGS
ncbi:hypothetical protein CLAIMM_06057, partial [Cladophialophora immunda]